MAPDVFQWHSKSNKLELKEAHREQIPWKTAMHHRQADLTATWLYCEDCHNRLFCAPAQRHSHVPFRDLQSAQHLRGDISSERSSLEAGASEELRAHWDACGARHARCNKNRGGTLRLDNLIPVPQRRYWQHAPEAPFEKAALGRQQRPPRMCAAQELHAGAPGRARQGSVRLRSRRDRVLATAASSTLQHPSFHGGQGGSQVV